MFELHLLGAGVSLILVGGAVVALLRQQAQYYRFFIRSIGVAAIFQILTGIGLMWSMSSHTSAISACARVGVYVLVVCSIEAGLLYRLRHTQAKAIIV